MEEGNINVNARWIMPPKGILKCNVRSFFSPEPLPNGNHSGIGVVFRNSLGNIMHMSAGSLGFHDLRENQFNAFMEGLKEAFYKDYTHIILETDEADPYWEWYNSTVVGGPPQYASILQQLNQRRADKNFITKVRLVDREDNQLAAYLAEYGAAHWKQMIILAEPFGRVEEIWHHDMGLGNYGARFRAVYHSEVNPALLAEEVVNPPQNEVNLNEFDNGMEILAAAAAVQGNAVPIVGEGEGFEADDHVNAMDVVVGLPAMPVENGFANEHNAE